MGKLKIRKIGLYRTNTLNCWQENDSISPEYFTWVHENMATPRVVYCEQTIGELIDDHAEQRIALLWESHDLRPNHYEYAVQRKDYFDLILTYDVRFLRMGEPFAFYPVGGSWIRDWGMFDKTELVSILVGYKDILPGHKMRFTIADMYPQIHALRGQFEDKKRMLRPYMFSVVVESSKFDFFFSEKLIDCISQGCMPIYYGCPGIGNFFDERGLFTFDTPEELDDILKELSPALYKNKLQYLQDNLNEARKYKVTEDGWSENYPEFFKDEDTWLRRRLID